MLRSGFLACLILLPFIPYSNFAFINRDDSQRLSIDTVSVPCLDKNLVHYTAQWIKESPVIDGKLNEVTWTSAKRSPAFVDLISGGSKQLDTRAAVLWDDQYLYVGYWIEEPNVEATFTERDSQIWRDNDVELFIAGRDGYYELEINAYGTIYEVLFLWEKEYKQYHYDTISSFARNSKQVRLFNGVGFKNHPRGKRIGFWNWDYPGLLKGVHINGTINNANAGDKGWTVELALPWSGLKQLMQAEGRSLPPKNGETLRMDFSRFNTHKEGPEDSGGWVMSSHGVWDSHVPECFTIVEFEGK